MATGSSQSPISSESVYIDAAAASYLVDSGDAILIDVRDRDEYRGGHAAGAVSMPLSDFDAMAAQAAAGGRRLVFVCRSGRRSDDAANRYVREIGFGAVSLVGGMQALADAGFPTEKPARSPISIMRQVHMVIGLVVGVFTVLGAIIDPWFLLAPALAGGGLVYSGLSGTCGMAMLVSLLPWNRDDVRQVGPLPAGDPG